MSAELIDPFAPADASALTDDDIERVRDAIQEHRFTDPALFPSVHWIEFAALSALAKDGNPVAVSALRTVEQRAEFGGPLDEPKGVF